jgi:D-3-phosphoglycerate dehydrogenase
MTNRKRLLIATSITAAGWALLENRPDIETVTYDSAMPEAAYRALIPGAHGIALYTRPFGPGELAVADEMAVIGRVGVGYDLVDVPGCTAKGILLMTTGTANSVSVAEHALSLMFDLARRTAEFDAIVRKGDWSQRLITPPLDLYGRTLLVVGFGRIGSRIAARCRALEMTVLVCDPYVDAARIKEAGCEPVSLAAGLARADVVTVHCPKNAETTGMIGAAQLARLKSGAFVINTARGGIVDETALHDALVSGHLGGAGLDVFVDEPVPADHPLLELSNVVTAPHMAGNTVEALDRMSRTAIANILSVFDGAPNRANVINKEVLG